ncbi:N-acetylmuramoyl-L-alanine amidase [Leptothermofonsia sichuanensis E412]|uniref:peptidoglycan recognition protein family protein n=1 Tax=Leptothermofonsia sichuanensis TaxID=2917832 RepID=UPI001CA6E548|nr:peptidoglycan recognition family protein [Leptothermofonsia sichuanensis]QZZ20118.1 N-acetylmuramoyl-L-alanine amidase [Leptothermofonsia sichuanensis E412]
MLQIIQAPQGPILVKQQFLITGVASPNYAGRTLTLTIDNQYTTTGPRIAADGTWQLNFLFQQAGSRRLRIAIDNVSVEIPLEVVTTLPRLQFTQFPTRAAVGQTITFAGEAKNYASGTTLVLRVDGRFEIARPVVQSERWQAPVSFNQSGTRLVEIIGSGQDRAQITLVVDPAPPRPPRLSFTNPPQRITAEQAVRITGGAIDYANGEQLLLRADQLFTLARPQVMNQQWEAQIFFHQPGKRLIEIIGSEQDRAQVVIEVQAAPAGQLQVQARTTWSAEPTPSEVPNLLSPKGITIHHTALSGALGVSATLAQEIARMRFIWSSHVNGNGWIDIGYHYIIMPSGRVFEARSERKRGAHDAINDGLGVAFDGIYSSQTISQQQYQSAVALCTILCKRYGITNTITPIPTVTASFGTRNLPPIFGHRDRVATECPGTEGGRTVRLTEIRQAVNSQLR